MSHCIIRLPEVIKRTGLSRSSIYLKVAEHSFPEPISLGDRAIGWIEEEVNSWLDSRIRFTRTNDYTSEQSDDL